MGFARTGAALALLAALAAPPAPLRAALSGAAQLRAPSRAQHAEYVVEVNKKGQVTRVRAGKPSSDAAFNAITYGNALQVFIRTPDGRAVSGTYRLGYDYDPKTHNVRRTVALIHAGGVDPDAVGAVSAMAEINRRRALRAAQQEHAGTTPVNTLPDLNTITGGKH
ncbi:MAG: hypothetical protein WAJ85_09545 [Candidatus Baltobacteraceae bacterium]